jgi:hypothetical protein
MREANHRPELTKALALCRKHKAKLERPFGVSIWRAVNSCAMALARTDLGLTVRARPGASLLALPDAAVNPHCGIE